MSYFKLNHAIRDQPLPRNYKAVLWALESFMSETEKYAWPSIPKLAEITGMSESTVKRTLSLLKDANLIMWKAVRMGSNNVNKYRINRTLLFGPPVQIDQVKSTSSKQEFIGSKEIVGQVKLTCNRIKTELHIKQLALKGRLFGDKR